MIDKKKKRSISIRYFISITDRN